MILIVFPGPAGYRQCFSKKGFSLPISTREHGDGASRFRSADCFLSCKPCVPHDLRHMEFLAWSELRDTAASPAKARSTKCRLADLTGSENAPGRVAGENVLQRLLSCPRETLEDEVLPIIACRR